MKTNIFSEAILSDNEISALSNFVPDMVFVAAKKSARQRVDGHLLFKDVKFNACSGSIGLFPLPVGKYKCSHLRSRPESKAVAMQISDKKGNPVASSGWSMDVSPLFGTARTLLRIHPDGGKPLSTEGCIGILGKEESRKCFLALRGLMKERDFLILEVAHDGSNLSKWFSDITKIRAVDDRERKYSGLV